LCAKLPPPFFDKPYSTAEKGKKQVKNALQKEVHFQSVKKAANRQIAG